VVAHAPCGDSGGVLRGKRGLRWEEGDRDGMGRSIGRLADALGAGGGSWGSPARARCFSQFHGEAITIEQLMDLIFERVPC